MFTPFPIWNLQFTHKKDSKKLFLQDKPMDATVVDIARNTLLDFKQASSPTGTFYATGVKQINNQPVQFTISKSSNSNHYMITCRIPTKHNALILYGGN